MIRQLTRGVLLVTLAFAVSCANKKPKEENATDNGTGNQNAQIDSKPLTFPPDGSDGGKIPGLTTVHFKYDSSVVDAGNRKTLADNAAWIKKNDSLTVQIEGHCDSRGSVEYNLALGERRAKAVKDYLVSLGVDAKHLTVISYGKEKPIDTGDNEAAFQKNRRANFVPLNN